MAEQEPPRIEFPCEYPIKVLGRNVPEFEVQVLAVFEVHAAGFDRQAIFNKISRNGKFTSMTVFITATGKPQLKALHQDLLATGLVQMVI